MSSFTRSLAGFTLESFGAVTGGETMLVDGGCTAATALAAPDSTVTLDWGEATLGAAYPTKATLKVTDGGDPLPEDFETWMAAALDGRLDLGSMVSVEAPFTDEALTEAFRAMLAGEVIRTVIRFD